MFRLKLTEEWIDDHGIKHKKNEVLEMNQETYVKLLKEEKAKPHYPKPKK